MLIDVKLAPSKLGYVRLKTVEKVVDHIGKV
jgi:hypothetical protein